LRFPHKGYHEKIWDHVVGSIVVIDLSLSCSLELVFGWSNNGWRNKLNTLPFFFFGCPWKVGLG